MISKQHLLYITGKTGRRFETLTLCAVHKLYCTNTQKAQLTFYTTHLLTFIYVCVKTYM